MAGSYYYSTPIGQGFSNLAHAISSIPAREQQAGLLAARQKLLDEQTRNEVVQRDVYRAQAYEHNARGYDVQTKTRGREGVSEAFLHAPYGTTGSRAGSAVETDTAADYNLLPTPPTTVNGAASSVTGPLNIGGQGIRAPVIAPSRQPASAGVPGGGTGVTEDLARKVTGFAALTGDEKVANLMQLFSGANLAAGSTDPSQAMSYVQLGAGGHHQNTPIGAREVTQQKVDEAAQKSKDYRYNVDVDAQTSKSNQAARVAGQAARDAAKPGKPDKTKVLNTAQLKYTENKVLDAIAAADVKGVTPGQVAQVVGRISARVKAGDDHATAIAEEVDNMIETTPEHEEPGRFFGTNKVPAKSKFKAPGLLKNKPPADDAADTTPAAAGDKPAGMVERGNIDLNKRPVVNNEDGSVSTVRSMGVNIDGEELLLPTVSEDGRIMDDGEAVDAYIKTGKHLGKFKTPEAATAYAEQLHQSQAKQYAPGGKGKTPAAGPPAGAKKIGTSGGKPVYELPNGKRIVQTD